jgi:hypothetical protein
MIFALTDIVLTLMFLFFVVLAFATGEPFLFGMGAVVSWVFGADLVFIYLSDPSVNWMLGILGFALFLFGVFLLIFAVDIQLKTGGKQRK